MDMTDPEDTKGLKEKREDEERQSLRVQGALAAFFISGFGYFWYVGGLGDNVTNIIDDYIPRAWAIIVMVILGALILYQMWMRMIWDVDGYYIRSLDRQIKKIKTEKSKF